MNDHRSTTEAFSAEGLVKRFGGTTALDGVDLVAAPGTVLGVLGPNGAGKSTAIRVLATLASPDAGSARVGGHDVVREASRVRRLIGLTGQYATLDEELTGRGNLVLLGRLLDLPRAAAAARAEELLERFGLTEPAGRRVSTYSGGMRRRLDLAASLVGKPAVVFLDEPSVGLDPGRREDLWGIIRGVVAEGAAVLLTTQYLEEADALADAISVIDCGRVIAHGTPAELKRRVGGQTITVHPADPSRLDEAAALLAPAAQGPVERSAGHGLRIRVEGDDAVPALTRRLADAGVELAEFSLRLPSLDEAFLSLTGASAGTPASDEAEETRGGPPAPAASREVHPGLPRPGSPHETGGSTPATPREGENA
jgi:oleandomycin transport system ATP-binding protein